MTLQDLVAASLFLGVLAYSLFAGADFGSGFWDLTAGNAKKGAKLRSLIDHSIGPVWEANHVWLIFIFVVLWTGFPTAFAAIMTTLQLPLALALVGIVLRGSGFAFRKFADTIEHAQASGIVFATSSIITPFFFGAIVGSVASGRVPEAGYGDLIGSWTSVTSMIGGLLAVAVCAYLSGVFLLADASRTKQSDIVANLKGKVVIVGLVTGLIAVCGALPLRHDSPFLFSNLSGRAFIFVAVSFLSGSASMWLVYKERFTQARIAAASAVGSVVVGWGAAQYPWIVVNQLSIDTTAGARPTLIGLIVVVGLAAVIVFPALGWLYKLVTTAETAE